MIHRLIFPQSSETRAFLRIVSLRECNFVRAVVFVSGRHQKAGGDAERSWETAHGIGGTSHEWRFRFFGGSESTGQLPLNSHRVT